MRSGLAASLVVLAACATRPAPTASPLPPPPSRSPSAPPPSPQPTTVSWLQARKAARAALETKDHAGYRAALQALYDRSGSVWLLHDLAAADVTLGERARALREIASVVSMGMALDLDHDADLAALKTDPAWPSLLSRAHANEAPVSHAHVFAALPAEDLITEDLAYDPASRTFFVSSIRHRKIVAVDAATGRARDFVAEGAGGIGGVAALAVQGRTLWATTVDLPHVTGIDPHAPKRTALLAYDVQTGAPLDRIDLPADGAEHALTDMTVAPDGTAYVSDATGGTVYVHAPGSRNLSPVSPPSELASPQTPALGDDGKTLFVADYVRGIAAIDLRSHALSWLERADDVALTGIDGLTACPGGFLAVQNGMVPPRVARLVLDGRGRVARAEVLERSTSGLGDPTHGVRVGRAYYFLANTGWSRYDDDGRPAPHPPVDAPAIWEIDDAG